MILIGAAGTKPDQTRALAICLILCLHVLAWLVWMLVYSWRRKTAYLVGGYRCPPHPRDKEPITFWSIMILYSLLAILSLAVIGFSIVTLARGGNTARNRPRTGLRRLQQQHRETK